LTVSAWRITKRKYSKIAFSGEGARLFGGRWNSPGVPVVYAAGSQSLAALEMLVHFGSPEQLHHYVMFQAEFDDSLVKAVDISSLPKNWRASPPPAAVRAIGDEWVRISASPVLRVPSVLVPAEINFLINPEHRDFPQLEISKPLPFDFDHRFSEE
jgi:RES domain-containing protein